MDYSGGNDDRKIAAEIRDSYLSAMTGLVCWLADHGHQIRLLAGDSQDLTVIDEVLSRVRQDRPDLPQAAMLAEPALTISELMSQLSTVETVVATRYHTVLCALMLGKPTLAVGYADKFGPLMADMGLADFCQSASSPDLERMTEQFTALQAAAAKLRPRMAQRTANNRVQSRMQFDEMSVALFPHGRGRTDAARAGSVNQQTTSHGANA